MSEWHTYKLKDITTKIGSGSTPTGGSGAYKAEGITLIRSQNVLDYKFTEDGLAFIDDDQAYSLRNVIVEVNDVLLNITGDSVARCCGAPANWLPARVNQHVAILRSNPEKLDHRFLKYSLLASKEELLILSEIGGTRNALTKGMLEDYEVILPPLPEQKAIASVLSSLDDKIDLLHRQNKTLEAMAETLFRQWFIEEAKEDWEDGTLDQLIDLKYGKALKQEDRSGSGYPVVASSGIVGFHNNYLVKGPGIVIGRKGTLGKVYFMEDNFYPIDTSYFIETKTSGSNLIFEYYLLKSLDFANMNSDSAVPGLNRNIALGTQIQVPPEELILSFNGTAQPWFSKIHSNTKQIQTLEKLRDTLLPKLMSGEVRVQYQTEEVA